MMMIFTMVMEKKGSGSIWTLTRIAVTMKTSMMTSRLPITRRRWEILSKKKKKLNDQLRAVERRKSELGLVWWTELGSVDENKVTEKSSSINNENLMKITHSSPEEHLEPLQCFPPDSLQLIEPWKLFYSLSWGTEDHSLRTLSTEFFVAVVLSYLQWVQEGVEAGAEEQWQHGTDRHHIVEFGFQNAAMLTYCLCMIGWKINQRGVLQTAGEVLLKQTDFGVNLLKSLSNPVVRFNQQCVALPGSV